MRLYSGGGKRLSGGGGTARGGKRLRPAKRSRRFLTGTVAAAVTVLAIAGAIRAGGFFHAAAPAAPGPDSTSDDASVEIIPLTQAQPVQEESDALPDNRFLLSFAGDCTLGVEHTAWGKSGSFPDVVGENYAYPLSGVKELFSRDDFTFVNLECALTSYTVPAEKEYRFRGLPAYGQILTEGSVEAVTLANNHSLDYGKTGLAETRQVLENLGISAGGDGETFLYTTSRGLKIGVYTAYHFGRPEIKKAIESLQAQGAEVIVAAFHAGVEGSYTPSARQRELFRYAAECGAHIVYNSHPHVLQPMEQWGESVILYSMWNFCFGGNRNPSDKDTAIIQVEVERQDDGTIRVCGTTVHPCSVSSRSDRNDYRPTLYSPDSDGALRVERKLAGTYQPPQKAEVPQTPAVQEIRFDGETTAAVSAG